MREGKPRMFQEKPELNKQKRDFLWPPLDEFQRIRSEYVRQNLEDIKEILQNHGAQETEIPLLAELFARAFFVANYVEDHLKSEDITDDAEITFHREEDVDVTAHATAEFTLNGKLLGEDDLASIPVEQAVAIRIENVEISFNLSSFEMMTKIVNATIKKIRDQGYSEENIEITKRNMLDTYAAVIERISVEEAVHSIDLRRAVQDVDVMKQVIGYHHTRPKDNFQAYKSDPLEQRADQVVKLFLNAYYPDLKISETVDAVRTGIKQITERPTE